MSIYDLKIGDKLRVLITGKNMSGVEVFGDILEITKIDKEVSFKGEALWIYHEKNSFFGGGFRITDDKSKTIAYELGVDLELVLEPIVGEDFGYLIDLFKRLNIK